MVQGVQSALRRRFILTGAPGAGKTALLRQLEVEGFGVVELQRRRRPDARGEVQFRAHGVELVADPPGNVAERADSVRRAL